MDPSPQPDARGAGWALEELGFRSEGRLTEGSTFGPVAKETTGGEFPGLLISQEERTREVASRGEEGRGRGEAAAEQVAGGSLRAELARWPRQGGQ